MNKFLTSPPCEECENYDHPMRCWYDGCWILINAPDSQSYCKRFVKKGETEKDEL